jgi:myo-inositol 2-dehydrogenase/D-chiro-inositol 1-dehydrogenase
MKVGMLGTIDHINLFAPEAAEDESVEFVGIAEPDPEKGKELAEKFGTKWYPSSESLLAEKLDAVGIFTPFYNRADDIAGCLEKGLHVITDKPAATNPKGLKKIRKALTAHPDLQFTMGLALRVAPEYGKIRELVSDGAIGKTVQISARRAYRLRRPTRPEFMFDSALSGGIWVELAVHDVDCIRWITGSEFLSVAATHGNVSSPEEPYQDHAAGFFTMKEHISAFVEASRLVPSVGDGSDNRMHLVGSEGVIDLGPGRALSHWNSKRERTLIEERAKGPSMYRNFIAAIRNGEPLIAPAEDVLRATEVVLGAFASAEKGGARVSLK